MNRVALAGMSMIMGLVGGGCDTGTDQRQDAGLCHEGGSPGGGSCSRPDAASSSLDAGIGTPDAYEPDAASPHATDAGAGDTGHMRDVDAGTTADASQPDAGDPEPSMLLHASDGKLRHDDGRPVDFRGAISCCGGGYGWPLADNAWMDYVAQHSFNFITMRLGPFLTGPGGESDWVDVGGAYVEVDGKADLTQWNDRFWLEVRERIAYAKQRGMYVEVDIADGWAIKHCEWGDIPGYSAWDPGFNVQGEDWCGFAGGEAITPQSVHDHWVRKVIRETGDFDNVIYQDGNEIGLVNSYDPAWTSSMAAVVREVEEQQGFERHLFGTQSQHPDALAFAEVDYGSLHQDVAATSEDCAGKPCLVNEYNPEPALSPEALMEQFCLASERGTYFWYWRHGQSAEQMEQTLAAMSQGCP